MIGYFYIDKSTNQQCGPFSIDELKSKKITPDTMIWFSGLPNWLEAAKIPALEFLFNPISASTNTQTSVQPPVQHKSMYNSNVYGAHGAPVRRNEGGVRDVRPIPKTWLVESILATVFCTHIFGIIAIVYASKVESAFYAGDYETSLESSKKAKMWLFIGLGVMIGGVVLVLLSYFVIIIAAIGSSSL